LINVIILYIIIKKPGGARNNMSKYVVGIDLGGTNVKAGIVEESTGKVVVSKSIKTNSEKGVDDTFNRIANLVNELLAEKSIDKSEVKGAGLGIPGPVVNFETVTFFANFPWERNLNIAKILGEKLGLTVKVGNDANVITLGEVWMGAAKGYKNVLGLTLGTGIGGGIVVDGKLVEGFTGAGAEVGHIKLEAEGRLCGCGQKGCWEAYSSATGIIREAVSRLRVNKNNLLWEKINGNIDELEAKQIFDAAKEGDKFSEDIVDFAAKYLAMGIGNLLNVLNPEVIVVGGGVALAGDFLFDKVKKELEKYALSVTLDGVEIVQAALGNDAGVVGAAALLEI
jgi:glucokinase